MTATNNSGYMKEDLGVVRGFELTEAEMAALSGITGKPPSQKHDDVVSINPHSRRRASRQQQPCNWDAGRCLHVFAGGTELDARADFGCKGDGAADDWACLQVAVHRELFDAQIFLQKSSR